MGGNVNLDMEDPVGTSTVGKAIEVLDLIYKMGRPVRFRELEELSRFPKPTLYRFVQTLTEYGMLNYDTDRNTYFLGLRLVRLAHAAWRHSVIGPVAQPHLAALANEIREAVYLSRLDAGQCVCLDRGAPDGQSTVFFDADRVYPSYCTAVGKAMLACLPPSGLEIALTQQSFHPLTDATITDPDVLRTELEQVRAQGYAIENEEHVRGILAVAVPIVSPAGKLLGGLGIHASDRQTDLATLKTQLDAMRGAAQKIARDVADWRFPEADEGILRIGA